MEEPKTLDILKVAILLERSGKAFYKKVSQQTDNEDVKNIFEIMANEEDEHIKFLTEQYLNYSKNQSFKPLKLTQPEENTATAILCEKIKNNISAASYEAAAIASAIDMENKAIAVYTEQADQATDIEEKNFYKWLAKWEKGHHKLLFDLEQELIEKVWEDQNFWPF